MESIFNHSEIILTETLDGEKSIVCKENVYTGLTIASRQR